VIKNACRILLRKPGRKRPLGRPRNRHDDNIKINLNETGHQGINLTQPAKDRDQLWALVNTATNHRISHKVEYFLSQY
jgi:hypothetical protein